MPMVHFVGEIKVCKVAGNELFFQKYISLTWAIVAGAFILKTVFFIMIILYLIFHEKETITGF